MSEELPCDLHCASSEAIPAGFDYKSVPELADELRATAKRIREWMSGSVIDIGAELIAVRNRLEHGRFLHWVHADFGLSPRTAENMMAAKRWADGKNAIVADLAPTAIYALAAKSTPPAIQAEILARLESGEKLPPHIVIKMIRAAKTKKPTHFGQQNNQLPLETQPGPLHTVQAEPAGPIPGESEPDRSGPGQPETEQRDATRPLAASPERQEQIGFTWEAGARQLIELLVTAVLELEEIPHEETIIDLLIDCRLRHLRDRLSERPGRTIKGTQRIRPAASNILLPRSEISI